jgi:hypothetical protein
VNADALEAPAQPSCPSSAMRLALQLQLMQQLPSFVAPGA